MLGACGADKLFDFREAFMAARKSPAGVVVPLFGYSLKREKHLQKLYSSSASSSIEMIFYTRDVVSNGETELPDNARILNRISSPNFQISSPDDSFFEDLLKVSRTRTYTHTCNPPGPDETHTSPCYHLHTQAVASEEDDVPNSKERSSLKPRRSSGNREAVRKYREKKKAHTAFLEEEVKKLRQLNQQLVSKLQGQTFLENEVLRLRSVLKDIKGKIEDELGVFPFPKQSSKEMTFKEDDCVLQSNGGGSNSGFRQTESSCFKSQFGSSADHFPDRGKPKLSGEKHAPESQT